MARVVDRLSLVSLFVSACTGPAAVTAAPVDVASEVQALGEQTGHAWTFRISPELGTLAFLEGRTSPVAVTPSDADRAARAFFTAHAALFSLPSADSLATLSSVTLADGTTHTRYQQRLGRIPIWGSQLLAHFDATGALVRWNGRYGPVVPPDSLVPMQGEDQVRVVAAIEARSRRPTASPSDVTTTSPTLLLYPMEAELVSGQPRPCRLALSTVARVAEVPDGLPLALEVIVDAEDGHILYEVDHVQSLMGSGVGVFGDVKPLSVKKRSAFWLEDATRGGESPSRTFSAGGGLHVPGSELRSSTEDSWDVAPDHGTPGAGVDAHAYVAATWDYFLSAHGRAGFADDGVGIRATVHYGDRLAAAFFDGTQLVFGDGNGVMTTPAAAFDLVAHEYTHGVIAATAGLSSAGASGSINEGLADLFGCLASFDSGQGAAWQIGETVYHPRGHDVPMRDLADPHATGQPAELSEADFAETDPHVNASLVGHLGYLIVEGSTDGPHALGTDLAGKLFYRATTSYLFQEAGYLELADALLASVRDLAPDREPDVRTALGLVGIL